MFEPSTQSEFSVQEILNDKIISGKLLYFVKWKGFPHSQNSWEPQQHLKNALDHINLWKEKKKKLQKADQVSKRKKPQQEDFSGEKYVKKTPIKADHPKRQTRRKKNPNNTSQILANSAARSTSDDDSNKSCNSETTSCRGKVLKRKTARSKTPIDSIVKSLIKIKEGKSNQPQSSSINSLDISQQLTRTKGQPKKPTPKKQTNKKNIQQKSFDKSIECLKKINQPKKLTKTLNSKQPKQVPTEKSQKNIPKPVQNPSFAESSKEPILPKLFSTLNTNPEPQEKMYSIKKKQILAIIGNTSTLPQSSLPLKPNASPPTLQKPEALPLYNPLKQVQQPKPAPRLGQSSQKIIPKPILQLAERVQECGANTTEQKGFKYQPGLSKSFMNPQIIPSKDINLHAKIAHYSFEDYNQKLENYKKQHQKEHYSLSTNQVNDEMHPEKPRPTSTEKNSSNGDIRPAIYDEMEKEKQKSSDKQKLLKELRQRRIFKDRRDSRDRSREDDKKRDKKDKRDKKRSQKQKHKKKIHDKRKKRGRSPSSSSSERNQRRRHRKRKNSESSDDSSSNSSRSSSPKFSESNDDAEKYNKRKEKQVKKMSTDNERKQKGKEKSDHIIEIAESSSPTSSSLAFIDQEQFESRTNKKIFLNQDYGKKYKSKPNAAPQKQSDQGKDRTEKHDISLMKETQIAIQKARGLYDFLAKHQTKWWEKDPKMQMKEILKSVREQLKRTMGRKQGLNSSYESEDNWNFPFDNNRQSIKPQTSSKGTSGPSHSTDIHEEPSSSNAQISEDEFNLLVSDIQELFLQTYPDETVTPQIKKQIIEIVKKMTEQNMEDSFIDEWLNNFASKKEAQKKDQEAKKKQSQNLVQKPMNSGNFHNSQEVNKNIQSIELNKSKKNFEEGAKSLDYISSFFKPKEKKTTGNVIELENDNEQSISQGSNMSSMNLSSQQQTQNASSTKHEPSNVEVKRSQSACFRQQPQKPIEKQQRSQNQKNIQNKPSEVQPQSSGNPHRSAENLAQASTGNQKAKNVVETNNIIKIITQFLYRGQKCFKILLNNGKQANAHEADVKKNCPKLLLDYYEKRIEKFEAQRRRNAHQYTN